MVGQEEAAALPRAVPTEQDVDSAATFLAAVKARLTEWGKRSQYKDFVMALTGSADIDAEMVERVLLGHDDLIRVFRRMFAPSADLWRIKAEIKEELSVEFDDADDALPPLRPPQAERADGSAEPLEDSPSAETSPPASQLPPHGPDALSPLRQRGFMDQKPQFVKEEPKGQEPQSAKEEPTHTEALKENQEVAPHPPAFNPTAWRPTVTIDDETAEHDVEEVSIATAIKKGRDECVADLAKTIFRKERSAHQGVRERIDMVRYAMKRIARLKFPRELFILRGAPGIGKTDYAVRQLHDLTDIEPDEALAARLTHVCSTDDSFQHFTNDGAVYKFVARKLEKYCARNETRVRLAMEAGIHPIFVDDTHMRLWEMRPYVKLADRLGYVTTIVEPYDICEMWDDLDYLVSANDTTDRRWMGKVVPRDVVKALLTVYEPTYEYDDPLDAVRAARWSSQSRVVEAEPNPSDLTSKMPRPCNVKAEPLEDWGSTRAEKMARTSYFHQAPPAGYMEYGQGNHW